MIFVICNRIKHSLGSSALLAATVLLAGCGFHLQGTNGELPTATAQTYLQTDDPYSDFYDNLRRALRERGATVVESPQDASAVLRIIEDSYGQRILSVSARNVPREYEIFFGHVLARGGRQRAARARIGTRDAQLYLGRDTGSRQERRRDGIASVARERSRAACAAPHRSRSAERPGDLNVVELRDLSPRAVEDLLSAYGLELVSTAPGTEIPASYWGAPEAGIAGRCVFVRDDTPAHSLLHELGHYVCMTPDRRAALWRDAGGDDEEESAVCYLQVLLADLIPELGRQRLLVDLDAWGYSFREGSAAAWFSGDGASARDWLADNGLIDADDVPTMRLRG